MLPVVIAIGHAIGWWPLHFVDRLDSFIYDVRLRATMPRTLDPRIVIVDIDDPSLQEIGQWPWSRDKLARLTHELVVRQGALAVGFDVLFTEADGSSGLEALRRLANGPLKDEPRLASEIARIAPSLDHDAIFANALTEGRVALGFYFTRTSVARSRGQLPEPVIDAELLPADRFHATRWNGFGGSIAQLAAAAPMGGFLNVVLDGGDGVVRSVPLIARYDGAAAKSGYYGSLALAVYQLATESMAVSPQLADTADAGSRASVLEALMVGPPAHRLRVPVDAGGGMLVPFRGPGGAQGGSFRYVSASDVLNGLLAPQELKDKIILVGATAPGLQDLRTTPVDAVYPGVEVHANIISAMLDHRMLATPDYAAGFDLTVLIVAGLLLAFGLSLRSAFQATLIALAMLGLLIVLNTWLYVSAGLVFPLAASLLMVGVAYVLNMSWAYFVEARASRGLANLFGTYVPPQLVDEMRADPHRYSMRAESKELTVMFCDMRGFTRLSEQMAPVELQAFLNAVFSQLTEIISQHRGTVDKYMGDCVMAFWGAPVDAVDHAALASRAAVEMAQAVARLNEAHRETGRPEISVGIGLNTGVMSVGDMGSAVRRSYTVLGDAVNVASRLEGLGLHYGVEIVASAATQRSAPDFLWQQLDRVRVKGKAGLVDIYAPVAPFAQTTIEAQRQMARWDQFVELYRAQAWQAAQAALRSFTAQDPKKVLYLLYEQRLASMSLLPKDPDWDGATRFETK